MARRRLLKLEAKTQPLASKTVFVERLARCVAASALLIGISLFAGILGYRHFEGMPWVDAFANAAMILSGMGPMDPMKTSAGKIFAGCYALYSGLMLILATGLILTPVVHRMLHQFNLATTDGADE